MKRIRQQNELNRPETKYRIALILSFVLPVVIMLSIFLVKGIYPFGDRSFLYSDMYHQYMPFFSEFLRKIRAGEGLSYSYNVGMGSNFLALYVYYLASPLHWLAFLFPEGLLMEFMSYLVVMKIGLAGLTFFLYLKNHFGKHDGNILFFACFYALSGFMAAYNWNVMWLDCVVLFPLVILGLERLVKEGKCGLYCVTLGLSIFTNYYISIMICIFLVLYFVGLLVTEKRNWRSVWQFGIYSLLAAGMAGILLVPEVCAILATDFGNPNFPTELKSYFSVFDMLARHCMCVTTERGLEHWPNIYCGAAVFILLPMYALNDNIPIRKRFVKLVLAGFMLLSFGTNVLDFMWHGMNYPDSLPARQSFIYIFLILVMCYEAFGRIKELDKKQIFYGFIAAAIFLLACEKFIVHEDFYVGVEVLTLLFVTIYAVLMYLYRTRDGQRWMHILGALTLVAVVAECSVNTINTSVGTTGRDAYLEPLEDYEALYQWVQEQDDDFYRVEKFTRKTKNDGTLAGYPTASVFSSTMNSHVMDLYTELGMRHSKVYYCFDGATAFTSALLNVDYMFGESDKYENSLYTMLEKSGDVYLYRVQNTLPFGYVAPFGYDLPEESLNGLALQNDLVEALGVQGRLFIKEESFRADDDVTFTAEASGIYYGLVTASGTKKIEAIGGPMETQQYADLKSGCILYLGHLEAGDAMTLTNGDEKDDTPQIKVSIYWMDEQVLQEALSILGENSLQNVSYDTTCVNGDIVMEKEGRLILSVPYEKGWKIKVNEEMREPEIFGGAWIAFDLQPGEYRIEMEYTPYGSGWGIVLSLISVTVFVLLMYFEAKKKRRSAPPVI